ncbi:MAG: ribonuclease P protein component 4 [Candidatus Methanodesulfokora sp.]|nr:MAG: ribonuclease P [Candidatus Korarchaeota archaeon]
MPRGGLLRRARERQKKIAGERIRILLNLADAICVQDIQLAERYGDLARRISMRTRVNIPAEYKWRYCRKCKKLLFPGINSTVRVRSKRYPHIVIKCKMCEGINRRPFKTDKKGLLGAE